MIMETDFWISLCLLIYTWMGYFFLLVLLVRFSRKTLNWRVIYPPITVLVTAYNEEKSIEKRLNNLLCQDYAKGMLDILVASDGSTDRTNQIVEFCAENDNHVRLYAAKRQGKSATQNSAIPLAQGDIVVLTDADTVFKKDTLKQIARNFADSRVGCVSGRLILGDPTGSVAESQGLYWNFEMALRRMESQIGAMHTASGSIMAFRKDLFRPFDSKFGDDCIIPLDIIMQGYWIVHDDSAIAYDTFPASLRGELKARTRMTLRNITCTLSKYQLLNPFKYPLVSLAIVSHKLLRWLTPFFMLAALLSNIFLVNESVFYLLTAGAQVLFYSLGVVGFLAELLKFRIPVASQIFSFLLANLGFLLGVLKAVSGKHVTSYKNHRACHG